jgi:prepilin-type processing-associated H-X9-DG protein
MSLPPPYYRDAPPPKKGMPVWGWVLVGCLGMSVFIIMGLAVILFPVFAQAREKARQTSCLNNIKQMSLGMLMYTQDYDGKFPPTPGWMDKIAPYIKKEEVYHCPTAKSDDGNAYGYSFNAQVSTVSVTKIASPATTALVFDSIAEGRSASAKGLQVMTPGRHARTNNIGYTDGHAQAVPTP